MKDFNTFQIDEAASIGVDYEWAIVYFCLLDAKKRNEITDKEIQDRIQKFNKLNASGYRSDVQKIAKQTVDHIPVHLRKLARHADEDWVFGNPEPKTDILFGKEIRASVKFQGEIKLQSSQGKSSAIYFRLAHQKVFSIKDEIFESLVDSIDKMPTQMLDPKNTKILKKENPRKFKMFVDKGNNILPEFNWKIWEYNNKEKIKNKIIKYLKTNKEFHKELIYEFLTGSAFFSSSNNKDAIATHILTPKYFKKIDDEYISSIIEKTSIDIRAKGRNGLTSVTLNVDSIIENKLTQKLHAVKNWLFKNFNNLFHKVLEEIQKYLEINISIKL